MIFNRIDVSITTIYTKQKSSYDVRTMENYHLSEVRVALMLLGKVRRVHQHVIQHYTLAVVEWDPGVLAPHLQSKCMPALITILSMQQGVSNENANNQASDNNLSPSFTLSLLLRKQQTQLLMFNN